ncbi:MAG: ATP synthase F1 subunit delta, partial [Chitinophagia bacterium]|nr:ATP synthase F1 subunit delta [Chitinophagia bacterium]
RIAHRYAKSLIDLALEQGSIENILADMQLMLALCKQSHDFELMLRSPVIKGDKKIAIIEEIVAAHISPASLLFFRLLVQKGREVYIKEIIEAFIAQYNVYKNIKTVQVTTAVPLSEQNKQAFQTKLQEYMPGTTIVLNTKVDESIIGGFILQIEDKLYDAGIKKKLNDFKVSISQNAYLTNLN